MSNRMRFSTRGLVSALLVSALLPSPAWALSYFELEVPSYNTSMQGRIELENSSSFSDATDGIGVLRTSFDFSYALTDWLEVGAFTEFLRPTDQTLQLEQGGVQSRVRLFEKGEMPMDLGAAIEIGFPRTGSIVEAEFRGIIEKDLDRFTLSLSPAIEKTFGAQESDDEQEPTVQFSYAASVAYRISRAWKPHLDFFSDVGGDNPRTMFSPAVDFRLMRRFLASIRFALGLNDATERHLGALRLEYEL